MTDDLENEVQRQAESRVGRTLKDKWTLDQLVGVGGMACVYAATHRNQKRVAIKMLHPELSLNAAIRKRFLREGYVANTVQHPGAVSVDDDDVTEDGCAFLVMELLDGETLEGRWDRKGKRLPPGEVLALIDRVLDTLVAAHARGIVHRDLKPENLFLTRDAQVKILDFGIARVREVSGSSKTQTGSLMGTPTFMPPEQARGHWDQVDAQSDLWAVGATMFTLLTGQFVHPATTVNEALVLAVTQPARSLGSLRPDLPSPMVKFVDRALAYEKAARWPDALAMQTALREAYAALESDWDEQTVLHQAAASLPQSTLSASSGSATSTALVTATSLPVLAKVPVPHWALAAGGAGILGLVVVLFLAIRSADPESIPEPPPAAARATSESAAPPATGIARVPAPPPLKIDDLPIAEVKPNAPAAPSVGRPAPPPAVPIPKASAQPAPDPPKSKAAQAPDPFAGRD